MDAIRDIGKVRQLFVDGQDIESMDRLERRLHTPERRETAIAAENPWELGGVSYMVTFQDVSPLTGERCFRAWYRCDCEMPPAGNRIPLIAYAESDDGILWRKPDLDIINFRGETRNNLVWGGPGNNMAPFRDDRPGVPDSERYKAIVREKEIYALVSEDGLRWRKLSDEPILSERPFDTHNIAFYDERKGRYLAYTRGVAGVGNFKGGVRWIRCAESSDFLHWTELETIDTGTAAHEHLYTNACVHYDRSPGTYLMFPSRFVPDREPVKSWPYGPGVSDIVFMSSRDGRTFDRSFMEAFVRPGPDSENWHERGIYMERGILNTSPVEMSLYGMEHWRMPDVRIRRYALRTDGFVSIHAGAREGSFVTKPFIFTGDVLRLNYATSATGRLRVEIQDGGGISVAGRSIDDCIDTYGDTIDGIHHWKDGPDVKALSGTPVKLRITMKDADLYAFRFTS